MPSYKTHLAGGLITYLLVYKVTTLLHLVRIPSRQTSPIFCRPNPARVYFPGY